MNVSKFIKHKIFLVAISTVCIMLTAQAATIIVNDPTAQIINNGLCSLPEAIIHANEDVISLPDCPAGSGIDTIQLITDVTLNTQIWISDPTYGRTGTPKITSPIIINGMGNSIKRDTVCSLNGIVDDGEYRLFINAIGGELTLQNITLENGCADGSGLLAEGGAILNHSGATLSLVNVEFKSNHANGSGGAVSNTESSLIIGITASQFIDNKSNDSGGAIANSKNSNINIISGSEFEGNQSNYGGALINSTGASINNINRSAFVNNSSTNGGGAINNTSADQASATIGNIEDSTFSGNSASNGGAVVNYLSNINNMNNLTFVDNTTEGTGGAVWNFTNSAIGAIRNSLFKNNHQTSGNECSGVTTGFNNLSNLSSGNCSGSTSNSLTGNKIAGLAYDGGLTRTHALLPGSEAINASGSGATINGQRGLGIDGLRDVGAFEHFGCQASALNNDGFNVQVDSVERFITAIDCANSNGNMTDTIEFSQDINLSEEFENDVNYGKTGTPSITSPIIIDGLGHTLQRETKLTCTIDGNSDPGEFRLLFVNTDGELMVKNLVFNNACIDDSNPDKSSGGAIINRGTVAIINSVFSDNFAGSHFGGAIFNINIISELKNNKFYGNSANNGGAIFNYGSITTIESNTFSDNSALYGGGLYNQASIATIRNNTFTNHNVAHGGGIFNASGAATISNIINNTFAYGFASRGSGIDNAQSANIGRLDNNLFYQNSGSDCYDEGISVSGTDNLSDQDANNCSAIITQSMTLNVGELLDNGCITPTADGTCVKTHGLLPESQALDFTSFGTAIDQRGFSVTTIRDVGAFEVFEPTVIAPADIVVEATGILTAVSLGNAVVTDVDETGLMAIPSQIGPFTLGQHEITWTATDSQGHIGVAFQTVTIEDTTKPVISLNGDDPLILNLDDTYIDPQATVSDNYDDTIQINGTGTIDTDQIGNYQIHYNHTDSNGNVADEVIRNVIVQVGSENCSDAGIDTITSFNKTVMTKEDLNFALLCANINTTTTDTINLAADITYDSFFGVSDLILGQTATPIISSPIILNGMGHSIQRDNGLPCDINGVLEPSEFRLIRIDSNGNLNLNNTIIANGCADGDVLTENGDGGAIHSKGVLSVNSSMFSDNFGNRAGAINNQGTITEISYNLFLRNQASVDGGAVYNFGTIDSINSSFFENNQAINNGGAMANVFNISAIENSTFSTNMANAEGGGLYNDGTIDLISNSTFSNNGSNAGGGILNTALITLFKNNTLSGNDATSSGGGIYFFHGTILDISNNLFVNNSASNGFADCHSESGTFIGFNNYSDAAIQGINRSNCINGIDVIDHINLNPNSVADLADNGCTTLIADGSCVLTHALLEGSEAIDESDTFPTNHDQRGFLANGTRDIGAFEYGGIDDLIFKNSFD